MANDQLVNGPYRLTVFAHMMELRQSVAMNGSSGPDVYEALTWSRVDPAMPLRATDRTYLAVDSWRMSGREDDARLPSSVAQVLPRAHDEGRTAGAPPERKRSRAPS